MDFSKARPFDPAWWKWLFSRLDQLEARGMRELFKLQHAQNVAAMAVASDKGIQDHWGRSNDLLIKTFNRLFPWMVKDEDSEADALRRSIDDLNRMWAEEYGDPNDPETQKRIWDTAYALCPSMRET